MSPSFVKKYFLFEVFENNIILETDWEITLILMLLIINSTK